MLSSFSHQPLHFFTFTFSSRLPHHIHRRLRPSSPTAIEIASIDSPYICHQSSASRPVAAVLSISTWFPHTSDSAKNVCCVIKCKILNMVRYFCREILTGRNAEDLLRLLHLTRADSIGHCHQLNRTAKKIALHLSLLESSWVKHNVIYSKHPPMCYLEIHGVGLETSNLNWPKNCKSKAECYMTTGWAKICKLVRFVRKRYVEFTLTSAGRDDGVPTFGVRFYEADGSSIVPS